MFSIPMFFLQKINLSYIFICLFQEDTIFATASSYSFPLNIVSIVFGHLHRPPDKTDFCVRTDSTKGLLIIIVCPVGS